MLYFTFGANLTMLILKSTQAKTVRIIIELYYRVQYKFIRGFLWDEIVKAFKIIGTLETQFKREKRKKIGLCDIQKLDRIFLRDATFKKNK